MGKYINEINGVLLPNKGKANVLITHGAKEILKPSEFREDLLCVVDNGPFEAVAYCYNEDEFQEFCRPCGRPKRWLILEGAKKFVE